MAVTSLAILGVNATSINVTYSAVVGNWYQIVDENGVNYGGGGAAQAGATSVTVSITAGSAGFPASGATKTVRMRVSTTQNGTYSNDGSATLGRFCSAPTVGTQTFSSTFGSTITHAISLTPGTGGTTEYQVTTTSAAPSTWTTTNSFTLTRGTTYWFWGRQYSATVAGTFGNNLTSSNASVSQQVPLDTTPDSYNNFSSLFDQTPNTTVTSSSSYTVTGINAPASISVSGSGGSGHQYGINGVYGSTNTNVSSGDVITARHTTGGYNTTATTTITIGGVARTFTSTTIVPPTVSSVSLDTTSAVRYIGCDISLSPSGSGGTLQYAVSTSATYNTGIIFTWQSLSSFSATASHLERGQTYYFWARRANDAAAASYLAALVPYVLPPATITTTAPSSTIAYNAGDQTNTVTAVGSGAPASGVYYRLLRDGASNVGDFNPETETLSKNVNLLRPTELPPPNTSSSYQWQCVRYINYGGDGLYDDCTGTGSSFTITRQNVPAPTSVTPTASTEGDPNPSISFTSTGGVGVDYNITAGASVPSTGWGPGPFTVTSDTSATITRGVTYTVWARSNYTYDAVNYTNFIAPTYTVPYLDPQYPSAVFPTAVNVFFGATSFDIDIFNGETSTSDNTFQIRTGSYTGTIVGTGNAILNDTVTITVNDTVGVNLGDTETYYITAYRSVGTGGSGGVTVVNVTTFTATTIITTPVVNDSQNLTSTEEDNIIDHTIAMTSLGGGGTIQYAISTSATYNASIVRTWQSNPAFTGANGIERGTAYYFWARRADSATYADSAGPFTAPYLSGSFSVTVSPSSTALIPIADTTDRSIELKAVEKNTGGAFYRFRRTDGIGSPVTIGNHNPAVSPALPKVITISFAGGDLPPSGSTWTYFWDSQRYTFAGGQTDVYSPCTGTNASFTLTREAPDTIPSPFNFPDAGRVTKNTIIYFDELQITGFDTATTISVSGSGSPEYKISTSAGTSPDAGTWVSTAGTLSPSRYVRVRHRSANTDNTLVTSTINIGGVTDNFSSETYRMPQYGVGTVTAGSTLLDSNNTSNVTVSWTSPDSFAQYRIRRLDYDPVNNPNPTTTVVTTTGTGSPSLTLLYSEADLPSAGYSGTYRLQTRIATAQGGNGTWYAARTPGNNDAIVEFTINRIGAPEVLQGQPFDLYSPVSTITHPIALAAAGKYGTVEYNVTSAASAGLTAGAAPTTGWTTSNYRSINRNSSYWFWARRSNNNNISVKLSETVPAAINDYGFLLYSSTGQLLMDSTSLTARRIAYGTVTGSGTATFPITVPISGRTAGNTSIVVSTPTPLTIIEGTNSIPPIYVTGITFGANSVSFQINYNVGLTMTAYYYVLAEG